MRQEFPIENLYCSFHPKNLPLISDEISNRDLAESMNSIVYNKTPNKYYKSMQDINITATSRVFVH